MRGIWGRRSAMTALAGLAAVALAGCVVINTGGLDENYVASASSCPPGLAAAFQSALRSYDPDVTVDETSGTSFQPSVIVPTLHGSCFLESGATPLSPATYMAFIPTTISGDALAESLVNRGFGSSDGLAWTSPNSGWLLTVTALGTDTYFGFDPTEFPQYAGLLLSMKP